MDIHPESKFRLVRLDESLSFADIMNLLLVLLLFAATFNNSKKSSLSPFPTIGVSSASTVVRQGRHLVVAGAPVSQRVIYIIFKISVRWHISKFDLTVGRLVGNQEKLFRAHYRLGWRFGAHAGMASCSLLVQVKTKRALVLIGVS